MKITHTVAIVVVVGIAMFALGWIAHTPVPPKTVFYKMIEYREVAAVAKAEAKRDAVAYTVIKAKRDSSLAALDVRDTGQVQRHIAIDRQADVACERALASCQAAVRAQDTVVAHQDTVIVERQTPSASPAIALRPYIDARYRWSLSDTVRRVVVRIGAELRLGHHWAAVGELNSDRQIEAGGRYYIDFGRRR
jgi:hypothetical protein